VGCKNPVKEKQQQQQQQQQQQLQNPILDPRNPLLTLHSFSVRKV
jgi:hypothetical protein